MSTTISSRAMPKRESLDQRGDPSRLLRYASNIPIVGGIAETVYGIQEIRHAKTTNARINGYVDTSLGAGGTLDNLARIPLFAKAWTEIPKGLLKVAGPVAGVAGGLTAALDGGRDIYNGIHAHDRPEEVIGSVKIAAGGVSAAGAFLANPVLMVAGTVMYTGAVIYQNRDSIATVWHHVENTVDKWVDKAETACPPPRLAST